MKKTACPLLIVILILVLTACGARGASSVGRQTASGVLWRDGAAIRVTVDLTGGWSVAFDRDVMTLYDGEITPDRAEIARATIISDEVLEAYRANPGGGLIGAVDRDVGYLITTGDDKNRDAIFARFSVTAADDRSGAPEPAPEGVDAGPLAAIVGSYASGETEALVEALGDGRVRVTVSRRNSARETVRWVMTGDCDPGTGAADYFGGVKTTLTFGEDGLLRDETAEYEDGAGRLVFDREKETFTWSDTREGELTFERAWG